MKNGYQYRDKTEREIAVIRSKLVEEYNKSKVFSEQIVTLSQELDLLILKYHKKYAKKDKKEPRP